MVNILNKIRLRNRIIDNEINIYLEIQIMLVEVHVLFATNIHSSNILHWNIFKTIAILKSVSMFNVSQSDYLNAKGKFYYA